MVAISRRLSVAAFTKQLCVFFDIPSTNTFGFQVVQVKLHPTAADFTLCSAFRRNFRFDDPPPFVIFGISEPDVFRDRDVWPGDVGFPLTGEIGIGNGAGTVFGHRQIAHSEEKHHSFTILHAPILTGPVLLMLVPGKDLARR